MTDDRDSATEQLPLAGVRVLDLSTLLPGPMATLFLAEAGADVVKIERPNGGDEMRSYEPRFGDASSNYAILNRHKRAFAADLKDPEQRDRVLDLAADADIVVEQFRPGVADRLGVGFEDVLARNSDVVYCSINGYGSTGPYSATAGHDLNYLAESALLGVVVDGTGSPSLPVSVLADIAAGTYPALVNILLALRRAEMTGEGTYVEVAMARNLQVLGYGYFATHQVTGTWPKPGAEMLTGGSPRYQIYPTSDGRHVACAALEDKFWHRLTQLVGLDDAFCVDAGQEEAVIAALTGIFVERPSNYWRDLFASEDVCTTVVATWEESVAAGHTQIDGPDRVEPPGAPGPSFASLPSPISSALRRAPATVAYPALLDLPIGTVWAAPPFRNGVV